MGKKKLKNDWEPLLAEEFEKPYYQKLRNFLKEEYMTRMVYPNMFDIFNALHFTAYQDVKVVILGQDPYHGVNQAHGLSFSVKPEVDIPPSLKNIYKELHHDIGCEIPNNGYLVSWAKQGVLLLNTVLTVRAGAAHSHRGKGWEQFTDRIIHLLNNREKPIVFILWGRPAQSKLAFINNKKHFVITSPHPSPLSANRGFFGSKPFSRTNYFLKQIGESEIDWQIPNV
ncbi:uracil-DNA glycosylase [Bacillus aquiflavi]|uniref:Uracil-DNA glycosylase n=1 Tax=Bacillus aquiflavi TaxID=2672567 RepID=A0A6B3VZF1_9BACI|nr:uracil-DNA glycosylase [Bacillus aquiflavi]MBA4537430.1 uracil-DNA glycosylase [Bacillus aquiflavi]NEY81685.1 uracil-DNA glycosylase [Bacillus aquiflavi]